MANDKVFAFLKELVVKGRLTAANILVGKTKGFISEEQAEELMVMLLTD